MDFGALLTGAGVVAGPYLAYLGVRNRGRVDETTATLKTTLESMSAQLDRQDKAIKAQGVEIDRLKVGLEEERRLNRELRREKADLEDTVRDQAEMIEDWLPIGLWIHRGATSPAPQLGWRLLPAVLDYARRLEGQLSAPSEVSLDPEDPTTPPRRTDP